MEDGCSDDSVKEDSCCGFLAGLLKCRCRLKVRDIRTEGLRVAFYVSVSCIFSSLHAGSALSSRSAEVGWIEPSAPVILGGSDCVP